MTYRVVLTKQARADLEAVRDRKTREAIRREISALSTNPAVPQRKMGGRLQNSNFKVNKSVLIVALGTSPTKLIRYFTAKVI